MIVIKKRASKRSIAASLKKLENNRKQGFDANKYCGTIKLKEDALAIQKRLRNEWGEAAFKYLYHIIFIVHHEER